MIDSRASSSRSGPPKSHGRMTTVMRSAPRPAPAGARVLRAALVRGGQVIDERVLPRGAELTVGPGERNTFVITELARSAVLIEHGADGYRLRVARGVSGRVAKGAAIHDLDTIDGALALGDDARGKIAVGGSVVLFHFVEPPVKPPRAQLPLAVRQGAFADFDWKTTCIAAVSFLCHFGAFGAVYSDWADPVTDDEARVALAVQIVKELPPPPPLEQRAPEVDGVASAQPTAAAPSAPSRAGGRRATAGPSSHGVAGGAARMGESRAHAIARELEQANGAMLLAIGARADGATGRVLAAGGEMPLGMLENVAAGPGGARPGDVTGLNLRGDGGGVVRPGAVSRGGLPGADRHADARAADVGKSADVKKPVGRASTSPPIVSGGKVDDAGRVVAGMRGQLRACYRRALDEDPTMRGSVRVTASIAPNGDVRSAQGAGSGLSSGMIACVSRVIRGAQFSAPDGGGGATLVIPMSFIPQ